MLIKFNNVYSIENYIEISFKESTAIYNMCFFIYSSIFMFIVPTVSLYMIFNKIQLDDYFLLNYSIINYLLWFSFLSLSSLLYSLAISLYYVKIFGIDSSIRIDKMIENNKFYTLMSSSTFLAYWLGFSQIDEILKKGDNLNKLILSSITFIIIILFNKFDFVLVISIINIILLIYKVCIFISLYQFFS